MTTVGDIGPAPMKKIGIMKREKPLKKQGLKKPISFKEFRKNKEANNENI